MRTQQPYHNKNLQQVESSDPNVLYQRKSERNQKKISLEQQLKSNALSPEEVVIRLFKHVLRQDLLNYAVFAKTLWFPKSQQVALMQSIISGHKNYLGESLSRPRRYKTPDELKAWLRPVVLTLWPTLHDHSNGETPLLRAVVWRAFDKASCIEQLIANERVKALEEKLETTEKDLNLLKSANPDLYNTLINNKKNMETITEQLEEMKEKVTDLVSLKEKITQLEKENRALHTQLKKTSAFALKESSPKTDFFVDDPFLKPLKPLQSQGLIKPPEQSCKVSEVY